MRKIDAVFEGGGVKGIALVGAIAEIEKAGYEFECLAGTSAGAIVAALLAVGYSARELKAIIESLPYQKMKDTSRIDRFWAFGQLMSIVFEYGIYEGRYFEEWLNNLLKAQGKTRFGDVKNPEENDPKYQYKLQVIAADLTDRRLLILPRDLADFGIEPEMFPISKAVRMSMSIPIFFEPVQLKDRKGMTHIIVDGGVLSNYPVWLLDDGTSNPPWPTFGFKLVEQDQRKLREPERNPIRNTWNYLNALAGTLLDAHDSFHISMSKGDYDRTIGIPTTVNLYGSAKEIQGTDFDLTKEQQELLYQNGIDEAQRFLKKWDFEAWKVNYRQTASRSTEYEP